MYKNCTSIEISIVIPGEKSLHVSVYMLVKLAHYDEMWISPPSGNYNLRLLLADVCPTIGDPLGSILHVYFP